MTYRAWLAEPGGLQYHVPFSIRLMGSVRLRLPGSQRAGELLEYVQSTVQGSTGFQDISLDRLAQIAASMGGKDRLKHQVAFIFQDARNRLPAIGSLGLEQISVSRPDLENDLEFWVRNTPSGLVASLDYRAHIAAHALVESLRDDLLRMLERLTESPSASVEGVVKTRLMRAQDVPLGPSGQQRRKGLFGRLKDRMTSASRAP